MSCSPVTTNRDRLDLSFSLDLGVGGRFDRSDHVQARAFALAYYRSIDLGGLSLARPSKGRPLGPENPSKQLNGICSIAACILDKRDLGRAFPHLHTYALLLLLVGQPLQAQPIIIRQRI